jgi:hypothetical protein
MNKRNEYNVDRKDKIISYSKINNEKKNFKS